MVAEYLKLSGRKQATFWVCTMCIQVMYLVFAGNVYLAMYKLCSWELKCMYLKLICIWYLVVIYMTFAG